ncbi:unnamed protein product [Polarella glacialis]|uniref:Uncharacterized protein n=1 Tax=Polarella glacialis TaxID=89957 RepID=A0A813KI16_POLGL|nr:unnamed protein product [Polarella glacialis]
MDKVKGCIFNIPICGGFCAPTQSPEESWLRHFSNEYTLPLAGVFMRMSGCLESNSCCRRVGATGTQCGRANRRNLMIYSFWVSFLSWLLTFYAAGGLLMTPSVLKATAWSKGKILASTGIEGQTWVGLHGRVDEVSCGQSAVCNDVMGNYGSLMTPIGGGRYQRAVAFSDERSCLNKVISPSSGHSIGLLNAPGEMCAGCKKSATGTVTFVVMGLITQIPQMTTDLQRATRFGDVNCQATMGFVTSLWGMFSGLSSLISFSNSCWRHFPTKVSGLHGEVDFLWSAGPGFLCMLIATVLKLWDAFAHWSLPTPTVRQTPPPKEVHDLFDYMIRAGDQPDDSENFSDAGSSEDSN